MLPENDAAVRWYCAARTQVRTDQHYRFAGFDYAGARVAADSAGITVTPELFDKLQLLESETIRVMRGDKD